jgi:tetratricopeptide (TPR) repeat protein
MDSLGFFRCFLRALAPGEKLHQRRFPFQFALAFDRAHQLTDFVVGQRFVGEPDVVFFLEAGLIVLVYRGTFYLPNIRADALFDRAAMLLEEPNPDFPRIESLLKEGLALRSNDFSGWMMLGNLHVIRGEREEALAAYQKARDSTPPSPFRTLFEEQVERVSSQPLDSVKPMRDPAIE